MSQSTYEIGDLRDRAKMMRSFAPKGNSVSPLEVTAEHLEWAANEIERLRRKTSPNCIAWSGGLCPNWGDDTNCGCRTK